MLFVILFIMFKERTGFFFYFTINKYISHSVKGFVIFKEKFKEQHQPQGLLSHKYTVITHNITKCIYHGSIIS